MFRFTIRDVLWLTVVVAMGLAWLLDRSFTNVRLADLRWQRDAALFLAEAEGYQWEVSRDGVYLYLPGAVIDLDDGQWIGSRKSALRTDNYPRSKAVYDPTEPRETVANGGGGNRAKSTNESK